MILPAQMEEEEGKQQKKLFQEGFFFRHVYYVYSFAFNTIDRILKFCWIIGSSSLEPLLTVTSAYFLFCKYCSDYFPVLFYFARLAVKYWGCQDNMSDLSVLEL